MPKALLHRSTLWDRMRANRLNFVLAFSLACIILYVLIYVLPPPVTRPFNEHIAQMLGLVLNAFGIPALTSGDIVSENGLVFKIILECTPIFIACLFVSFVAFHPASMRQKATGLALGIPALYLGNMVRLAATFAVSRYDRRLFEILHVYLGQVFTTLLVILCCLVWMRWVERGEAEQDTAKNIAVFLSRFVLISAGLFLIWLNFHRGYISFLDRLMSLAFSLFNRSARLACNTPVYYETFSVVIVASLVLAARSVPWRIRIPLLGAALGILTLIHLFHRIDNALFALYNITAIQHVDLPVLIIGQYLVPVLTLFYLIRLQRHGKFTG